MIFNYCPYCGTKDGMQPTNQTDYVCNTCGQQFWNNAKASTAIAFVKDGKLLVVERAREPNKGKFELAGGFVDYKETAYDCAIREAKEELGLTLTRDSLELIEVYHNNYNQGVSTIDIAFLVADWQGDPQPNDDVASVAWKPLDFIYDSAFCQPFYTGLDKAILARLAT